MERYIYILAPVAAVLLSQLLKIVFELRKDGVQLTDALASGGMPSSHSAGITALATVAGIKNGLDSPIFGLALTIAVLVIYDSFKVRRATGLNTLAIRKLQKDTKEKVVPHTLLAKGHTPLEALAGTALGLVLGYTLDKLL